MQVPGFNDKNLSPKTHCGSRVDALNSPQSSAGTVHAPVTATPRARLDALDLLRGIVMVVMMLDHTRDFFQVGEFNPTDLARTTPALFLTRWVTHFAAPVFVFLAGTGAYLKLARGATRGDLSRFLLTRGLWLVVLELTVLRVLIWFNADFRFLAMPQVIWAIGVSMIVLAGLVHLPTRWVGAFGVLMVAGHNLLDGIRVTAWRGPGTPGPQGWEIAWMLLHQQGLVFPFGADGPYILVLYPLIPWIGVLAAGYAFGALYRLPAAGRRVRLLRLGAGLTAAFVVLRLLNVYGDPAPWSAQGSAGLTALSFVNTTKYPASLLFLLMTLGPSILLLGWLEGRAIQGRAARALVTFGRVPLFYYLLQWPMAHGLAVLVGLAAGQEVAWQFATILERPGRNPGNLGFGLPTVYMFWVVGVVLLYPLCRWFAGVKQRRRDWWLSYL